MTKNNIPQSIITYQKEVKKITTRQKFTQNLVDIFLSLLDEIDDTYIIPEMEKEYDILKFIYEILDDIGLDFIEKLNFDEIKEFCFSHKRELLFLTKTETRDNPIFILYAYMVEYYPHRLLKSEQIDQDTIKDIARSLNISYDG
jgi:hypothetical protein